MDTFEAELAAIEQELKANLAAPVADTPDFLDTRLLRLRDVPFNVAPDRRFTCLIDIAWQYYLHGQRVYGAVEPIALAVMVARQLASKPQLRRALSVQGLILTATNNVSDALRSLVEALELAEEIDDPIAVLAAWLNIGNAYLEAALHSDARVCFDRVVSMAANLPDSRLVRSHAAKALHASAVCSMYLHEYLRGIESVKDAICLLDTPHDREQEQVRILVEATYTRLLLETNQLKEAAERAVIAQRMAEQAKSVRANISAATAVGLVEVYSGKIDVGLSRMVDVRDQSRILPASLRETLHASVIAYEKAERPDRALSMHRELMMHIRAANQEAIVQNQNLHLQRLALPDPDSSSIRAFESTDDQLKEKLAEVADRQSEFLEQMAMTVELREEDSGEHPYRVAMWARMLAIEAGLTEAEAADIELATRLHDIGKVVIPDSVIRKRTALSTGERTIIETHAATGAELLSRAKLPYAKLAEEIARYHHESWAGSGYPEGISGRAIPLPARIVSVCDAFDALVHERAYRRAWTVEETLGHLVRERALQFDPQLVDLFIPLVRRVYAEHADVNAFLSRVAQQTPLWSMRRTLERRLSVRPGPATINEQLRQSSQGRLQREPDKPT